MTGISALLMIFRSGYFFNKVQEVHPFLKVCTNTTMVVLRGLFLTGTGLLVATHAMSTLHQFALDVRFALAWIAVSRFRVEDSQIMMRSGTDANADWDFLTRLLRSIAKELMLFGTVGDILTPILKVQWILSMVC